MSNSSRIGAAILIVFAFAFAGMGMAFATKALSGFGTAPSLLPAAILGVGFVLIGLLLIVAAIAGWRALKRQGALKESQPDSPWLWREDWSQSRSLGQNRNRATLLWIATAVVSCVTLPWVFIGFNQQNAKSQPPAFFLIGIGSFSIILAISAIRATIGRERFGKTYFEFDSLPISPGKKLSGRVNLRLNTTAPHGLDARLQCVRRITTGSGKSQSTRNEVLWEAQQNVDSGMFGLGSLGVAVPVSFNVPADAYETNLENLNDKILWILHLHIPLSGVDFSEDYELPVFNTGQPAFAAQGSSSSGVFTTSFGGGAATATAPALIESEPLEQPATMSAVLSTDWNGTQFYFPALRNPAQALALFGFTAAWSGAVYLLYTKGPLLFTIVFGATDLLLIAAVLQALFASTRISVTADTLTLRKSFLGVPRTTTIPFSEIASILPVSGGQQSTGGKSFFSLRLSTKTGKKVTLVTGISNRQEARWLVAQLESAIGLKQDTHVEFERFPGVPETPPPRRGAASLPQSRSNPPGWIAIAFFAVWLSVVAGGIGFTLFGHPSPVRRRIPAKPRVTPQQVAPRTFAPLTTADVERIFSLPVQDQAEELLERSIEHDQRALDLVEKHLADWKGAVHESPRMKQLLNRAQYSRDLRVRYAYCDMMLAMDGWNENSQSVDILVQRAQSDPKQRAYDVWFLGMLGGRGVESERVHDVLLVYAQKDPDASVRQWATEGLRFLGTDQALDDLFNIFVSDPSFSVRDRAGCNLADCGNFTREQRMRMIPKFLELVETPSTNPQMRSWSFMALQGITDVNLPPEAKVWRDWYEKHGEEKLAEFKSIPVWQVRGDE